MVTVMRTRIRWVGTTRTAITFQSKLPWGGTGVVVSQWPTSSNEEQGLYYQL